MTSEAETMPSLFWIARRSLRSSTVNLNPIVSGPFSGATIFGNVLRVTMRYIMRYSALHVKNSICHVFLDLWPKSK